VGLFGRSTRDRFSEGPIGASQPISDEGPVGRPRTITAFVTAYAALALTAHGAADVSGQLPEHSQHDPHTPEYGRDLLRRGSGASDSQTPPQNPDTMMTPPGIDIVAESQPHASDVAPIAWRAPVDARVQRDADAAANIVTAFLDVPNDRGSRSPRGFDGPSL
jgi:hypothetical protein